MDSNIVELRTGKLMFYYSPADGFTEFLVELGPPWGFRPAWGFVPSSSLNLNLLVILILPLAQGRYGHVWFFIKAASSSCIKGLVKWQHFRCSQPHVTTEGFPRTTKHESFLNSHIDFPRWCSPIRSICDWQIVTIVLLLRRGIRASKTSIYSSSTPFFSSDSSSSRLSGCERHLWLVLAESFLLSACSGDA